MKILFVAAIALGLTAPAFAQDMGGMKMDGGDMKKGPPAAKSLTVKLDGKVKSPVSLSLDQLKAMPAVTVTVTYAEQGKSSWTGVSLMALIDKAAPVQPDGNGAYLQHLILARGTDNYASGIAIGEIDPKFEGKQAIIAYEKDGKPLDSLRLIVPGDAHAGRGVRDLAEITVN
jgi:DMSO/TMAO reductase YedYZ molybdopterin-dependent catalytic subunit